MKIDSCLQLLEKMKNFEIKLEQIDISRDKLLDLQQEIVELLLKANSKEQLLAILKIVKCNQNIEYIRDCVDVLTHCTEFYVEIVDILCNKEAIKAGIAMDGAKLVLEAKEKYLAEYAKDVLCNSSAIEAGVALPSAKLIINKAKEKNLAGYAKDVLCDLDVINTGNVLELVTFILNGKDVLGMDNMSL